MTFNVGLFLSLYISSIAYMYVLWLRYCLLLGDNLRLSAPLSLSLVCVFRLEWSELSDVLCPSSGRDNMAWEREEQAREQKHTGEEITNRVNYWHCKDGAHMNRVQVHKCYCITELQQKIRHEIR